LKSFIMLLAALGREPRHANVATPKHSYYFVLESTGSMAGKRTCGSGASQYGNI
jgi:hypothetical protein